ncbi:hypothetical protein HN51_030965 [Arachis hypogaea]
MELPLEEQIRLIKKTTLLLESQLVLQVSPKSENLVAASADNIDAKPKSKPIDKQDVNNYSRMRLTVDLFGVWRVQLEAEYDKGARCC